MYIKKTILIFIVSIICLSLSAQDFISTFLGKCGEEEKLEVVTIGKKMLEILSTMENQSKEFADVLKGLESIRIISSSNDLESDDDYYKMAYELLTQKSKGYEELISFHDENEKMLIMIKENKGTIRELVLLSGGNKQQFNLITLNGKINIEKLVKYSKELNINGLEKINSMQSKN